MKVAIYIRVATEEQLVLKDYDELTREFKCYINDKGLQKGNFASLSTKINFN